MLGLATSGLVREAAAILPPATLRRVAGALASHGRVRRGDLGITANPVRLPEALTESEHRVGLMLVSVEPGSPADRAGLARGDVIVTLGGQPVGRMADLLALLTAERIGQPVSVRILRGGTPQDVTVVVGERPPPP